MSPQCKSTGVLKNATWRWSEPTCQCLAMTCNLQTEKINNVFCAISTYPFPQILEPQVVSISIIAPCNFEYLQNVNLQRLSIGRLTTSFYLDLVWMWLWEEREPQTLLIFRPSCDGSGLIKLYIATGMTSACLFTKHNCWSKVGNMPATVLLVKQLLPGFDFWSSDTRQTDRKRCIRAHRA